MKIDSSSEASDKCGEVQFKAEKGGVVHAGVGKRSFDEDKLVENIRAFVSAVSKAKPSGAKGDYMKKINLSSTMSPAVPAGLFCEDSSQPTREAVCVAQWQFRAQSGSVPAPTFADTAMKSIAVGSRVAAKKAAVHSKRSEISDAEDCCTDKTAISCGFAPAGHLNAGLRTERPLGLCKN